MSAPLDASSPIHTVHLGLHCLIVDDEKVSRRLLARLLNRLGCTAVGVGTGAGAMHVLKAEGQIHVTGTIDTLADGTPAPRGTTSAPFDGESYVFKEATGILSPVSHYHGRKFDLVLMDIILASGASGIETTLRLRGMGLEIPVIATSGLELPDSAASGFTGVLRKPFDGAGLQACLTTYFPGAGTDTPTATTTATAAAAAGGGGGGSAPATVRAGTA